MLFVSFNEMEFWQIQYSILFANTLSVYEFKIMFDAVKIKIEILKLNVYYFYKVICNTFWKNFWIAKWNWKQLITLFWYSKVFVPFLLNMCEWVCNCVSKCMFLYMLIYIVACVYSLSASFFRYFIVNLHL